jgi:hypothetical protein
MYRAFNLTIGDWSEISSICDRPIDKLADLAREYVDNLSSADAAFEQNSRIVRRALEDFIGKEKKGKIDGSKMREQWFPQIDAHVFISHSHADRDGAIKLADFLNRQFKLKSFIDSCVWGHANDLLKLIDNQYCTSDGGKTYNYDSRNGSTSHVHMMLSTALAEVLDKCECAIFINTPNSITSELATVETNSPWIYFELGLMRLIREQKPERIQKLDESITNMSGKRAALEIAYTVDLSDLSDIDASHLIKWSSSYQMLRSNGLDPNPLDTLYKIATK